MHENQLRPWCPELLETFPDQLAAYAPVLMSFHDSRRC